MDEFAINITIFLHYKKLFFFRTETTIESEKAVNQITQITDKSVQSPENESNQGKENENVSTNKPEEPPKDNNTVVPKEK